MASDLPRSEAILLAINLPRPCRAAACVHARAGLGSCRGQADGDLKRRSFPHRSGEPAGPAGASLDDTRGITRWGILSMLVCRRGGKPLGRWP